MKRIEAFIQPHRLNRIVSALHALPQFLGFTVIDAHGQGHGHGAGGHYKFEPDEGLLYRKHYLLVVICADEDVSLLSSAIVRAAHTGNKGDGILVISDVLEVIRIHDVSGAA